MKFAAARACFSLRDFIGLRTRAGQCASSGDDVFAPDGFAVEEVLQDFADSCGVIREDLTGFAGLKTR